MNFGSFFASKIFPILLVNFIGIMGYSIVIPILIFMVQDFGGNGLIYGILVAQYPLFQLIGAPLLGKLSDRVGRKRVLALSQAGTFLAWVLFLLAFVLPLTPLFGSGQPEQNYVITLPLITVFLARIIDGFTGGNVSVANAYLSDISTDQDRNRNFGQMGASTSLGFVIGPAISGLLASTIWGEALPVMLAALISLVAIIVIQTRLKENDPCEVNTADLKSSNFRRFFQVEIKDCYQEGEETPKDNLRSVMKISGIPGLYIIYFLTFLAFSLFYAGLPLYGSTILSWTAVDLGIFLAWSSAVMMVVQSMVLPRLSTLVGNQTLIIAGSVFMAAGFVLLSFPGLVSLYLGNTLFSIGNGLMWPSFLSTLSGSGPKNLQGAIQGFGQSMGSLASIAGLALGGWLFEILTTRIFLITGVIFLIIVILASFKDRQIQKSIAGTLAGVRE